MGRVALGERFGWLWGAFAVSTFGTWLAFDALPLIAVVVLHAGAAAVSGLAAAGLAVGAVVAVPLGPWVEFRRKRPVMVAMDLIRCGAMLSIPLAYGFGRLGYGQLVVVSVVVAAADITFTSAAGACVKGLVRPEHLLVANARFESTNWTASVIGPPIGGAAIGMFGPVTTVVADAVSYLLSAAGIRAIGGTERHPVRTEASRGRVGDLLEGWRYLLTHRGLRPLFLNNVLVSGLIMAASPVLAVLMLGRLGFAPWQYGLAFSVPCVGGLVGSRLARPLVARYGRRRVMLTSGVLRVCWPVGLAFVRPGVTGLVTVMAVELGVITSMGVFAPVLATYRLEQTPSDRLARTLSAWSVTSKAVIAATTALWGLLTALTGPRFALAAAGLLLLTTPAFLLRAPALSPADPVPAPEYAP